MFKLKLIEKPLDQQIGATFKGRKVFQFPVGSLFEVLNPNIEDYYDSGDVGRILVLRKTKTRRLRDVYNGHTWGDAIKEYNFKYLGNVQDKVNEEINNTAKWK